MLYASPEAATNENYVYMDCSSYVNSVYITAFGIDVYPLATPTTTNTYNFIEYAENNTFQSDVVYYINNSDYPNPTDQTQLLADIKANLEIGDLVVYRYNNDASGHVMLYMGDDSFLHSTGVSYDYVNNIEKVDLSGTVQWLTSDNVFINTGSSRYLFGSNKTRFCVLRPLNRSGIAPKIGGLKRTYLQDVDMEKYASIANYSAVGRGEDITYHISLTNNGESPIEAIDIFDAFAADYVDFKEFPGVIGSISNNQLSWHVANIDPNETIVLSYTVTVKNDAPVGSVIASEGAIAEGIVLNSIYLSVIEYDLSELQSLSSIINGCVGSTAYSSVYQLLDYIYDQYADEVYSINPIASFSDIEAIFDSDLCAHCLYGGYDYDSSSSNNQDLRTRLLRESYLMIGDVLIMNEGSITSAYIFDGTNLIGIVSSTVTQYTDVATIIESATGHDNYKIIRPLLDME
jgi:uncharacterized repeat protein (TIGR01451 family)